MARWQVSITLGDDIERARFGTDSFRGFVHCDTWEHAAMVVYRREARRRGDGNHYIPAQATELASGEYAVRFGYPAAGAVVLRPACSVAVQKVPRAARPPPDLP